MNNLRRLLSAALVAGLVLGGGYAIAQTFTRAVQLSQDTSGAFLIDSNNNLYLPSHLMFPTGGVGAPAPTVAGTGSPTLSGTDAAGTVTMGTSATTATVTFGRAYGVAPTCVASWQSGNATSSPTGFTAFTTSIAFTQT